MFGLDSDWHWTGAKAPWGADKFCGSYMATKPHGVFREDERDDDDDDDDDDPDGDY
jgi:hypothetical protein